MVLRVGNGYMTIHPAAKTILLTSGVKGSGNSTELVEELQLAAMHDCISSVIPGPIPPPIINDALLRCIHWGGC